MNTTSYDLTDFGTMARFNAFRASLNLDTMRVVEERGNKYWTFTDDEGTVVQTNRNPYTTRPLPTKSDELGYVSYIAVEAPSQERLERVKDKIAAYAEHVKAAGGGYMAVRGDGDE